MHLLTTESSHLLQYGRELEHLSLALHLREGLLASHGKDASVDEDGHVPAFPDQSRHNAGLSDLLQIRQVISRLHLGAREKGTWLAWQTRHSSLLSRLDYPPA